MILPLGRECVLPVLTVALQVEPSQQVVAGLLQQHVVVSFIRAVWIVVVAQVTQATHCKEALMVE